MPALHPVYGERILAACHPARDGNQVMRRVELKTCSFDLAIPTEPNGGNHSPSFAKSARTEAAHAATMVVTKGLALLSYHILCDDVFFAKVSWKARPVFVSLKAIYPGSRRF